MIQTNLLAVQHFLQILGLPSGSQLPNPDTKLTAFPHFAVSCNLLGVYRWNLVAFLIPFHLPVMNARVNDMDTRTQDDGKPETTSGSQTDHSLTASDSNDTEVPLIPPARFWGLCVGYVPQHLLC